MDLEEEAERTGHLSFAQPSLSLSHQLVNNLKRGGLTIPTEVQLQVIPKIRNARGKDLCVNAPTGSGKTLAYALPIVEVLSKRSYTGLGCVVVVPTRELVEQVKGVFDLCLRKIKLKVEIAHGQRTLIEEQEKLVGSGPTRLGGNMLIDILIATPGRLAEHILHTKGFTLQHLQFLVLDEADRLLHQSFQNWTELILREISSPKVLDMSLDIASYIHGMEELPIIGQRHLKKLFDQVSTAQNVRKLIFSATLTHDVGKLASLQIHSPEIISVHSHPQALDLEETGDDAIFSLPTTLREYAVTALEDKPLILLHLLDSYHLRDKTLIFTHSTETATRLNHLLSEFYKSTQDDVATAVISSEIPLKVRKKLLSSFSSGKLNMYTLFKNTTYNSVITTDLLSRGMDIKGIQNIVNYDSPPTARVYVHRAGRTARAGKEGSVWTLVAKNEAHWFFKSVIPNIERSQPLERITIPQVSQQIKSHYTTIIEI